MTNDAAPKLPCPECGHPAIAAHGRGRYDSDGNYCEHRDGCRCHWCSWMWFDDADPVRCACGVLLKISVDDDAAYVTQVEEGDHV